AAGRGFWPISAKIRARSTSISTLNLGLSCVAFGNPIAGAGSPRQPETAVGGLSPLAPPHPLPGLFCYLGGRDRALLGDPSGDENHVAVLSRELKRPAHRRNFRSARRIALRHD